LIPGNSVEKKWREAVKAYGLTCLENLRGTTENFGPGSQSGAEI
jgi:hypothetical protein